MAQVMSILNKFKSFEYHTFIQCSASYHIFNQTQFLQEFLTTTMCTLNYNVHWSISEISRVTTHFHIYYVKCNKFGITSYLTFGDDNRSYLSTIKVIKMRESKLHAQHGLGLISWRQTLVDNKQYIYQSFSLSIVTRSYKLWLR